MIAGRGTWTVIVGLAFVLAAAGLTAWFSSEGTAPDRAERPASSSTAQGGDGATRQISLYCQFYVFVESRPFVAFLLEQNPDDPARYRQVYVAKADGDQTDYNVIAGREPEWRLDRSVEPPRLDSRVFVPDPSPAGIGEQDIAIELRGFDPAEASGSWREASLKSVYYQNLPGKCRQTRTREPDQRSDAPGESRAATILPTEASRSFTASASDFVRICTDIMPDRSASKMVVMAAAVPSGHAPTLSYCTRRSLMRRTSNDLNAQPVGLSDSSVA